MAISSETLAYLQLLVAGRYIDMAAGCLVVFDSLLVLDLEIKYIWNSKWSIMKVMYLINRYVTFLDFVLVCIRRTITDPTHCSGLLKVEGVLLVLGIYLAEYTFAMRTYVILERKKIFWVPISIFYAGTLIYSFVAYYSILDSTPEFVLPSFHGCLVELPPSNLWIVDMICLTAYDTAMIIVTGCAALRIWRRDARVRSGSFSILYGEGVLFYVYLLAFAIASLVAVIVVGSDPTLFLFMARCVRSILASRIILHIREWLTIKENILCVGNTTQSQVAT